MSTPLVWLRPIRWTDWLLAWRVAADGEVRAQSFDPAKPTPLKHLRWMVRQLRPGTGQSGGVVVHGRTRVGIVTTRRREDRLYIGIALLPRWRGRGFGTDAIQMLTAVCHEQGASVVFAEIKKTNPASRAAFIKAGYGSRRLEQAAEDRWVLRHPAK